MRREPSSSSLPPPPSSSYGQVHAEETPELVEQKLHEFDDTVARCTADKTTDNQDYLQATVRCPALLTREFKLLFLRSEVFRTDLAVRRYLNYWKKRVEIFGIDKAFEPLTLDGALSEDRVALEIGYLRLLRGVRDPEGRTLLFSDPSTQDKTRYSRLSLVRASWYIVHAALEDESAQKYGVVVIGDPSRAQFAQFDRKLSKIMLPCMQGAIPIRLAAYHVCKPPSFAALVMPIVKLFMSDRVKKRIYFHAGNNQAVLAALAQFGIHRDCVPTELGGTVCLDHRGWLAERRRMGL